MPFKEPPDLINDSSLEYIFDTSLGCIGLLKVWFVDSLGSVLEAGKNTLTIRDLEKHAPPIDVRDKISKEILDGERLLEEDPKKLDVIRSRLSQAIKSNGHKGSSARNFKIAEPAAELSEDSLDQQPRRPKAKKRRPGERNPTRDPVGRSRNRLKSQTEKPAQV